MHVIFLRGVRLCFLNHMDLVPDSLYESLPSQGPLFRRGTRYQSKCVGVWAAQVLLKIRSVPICAGVTPVGLWFVILLEPNNIGGFFSPEISTHKGFTSDTFNLIRHGVVPECECISFRYLCSSEKKVTGGVDDSGTSEKLSRRTQTSQLKQDFFAHASSTLTDHDK